MTKRPRWTEEVVQNLHGDNDDLDNPDEPLMEGSDDEFPDLEFDSDCDDDMDMDNMGGQHFFSPPSDNPHPGPALDPNSTNSDSDRKDIHPLEESSFDKMGALMANNDGRLGALQ